MSRAELLRRTRESSLLLNVMGFLDDEDVLGQAPLDRKSTRLNSSHANISYAVFCLKKKKKCNRRRCWRAKRITRPSTTRFQLPWWCGMTASSGDHAQLSAWRARRVPRSP